MVVQVNRKESPDQNELTKAAAWAWYERGSWFDHKTVLEADVTRRPRDYTPRPSRYKIEAMNESQRKYNESHVDNSALLDMYEIERISRELCCYVDSSRVDRHSMSVDGGDRGGATTALKETKGKRTGKKHKWGWGRHRVVCGSSREDVMEHALLVGGRLRRQQKDG